MLEKGQGYTPRWVNLTGKICHCEFDVLLLLKRKFVELYRVAGAMSQTSRHNAITLVQTNAHLVPGKL